MTTELSSLARRARVHAALGDPARLAIVDTLMLGDASPGEVGRDLGLPTNLVAHHLKVLETAGLLDRSRSEGDRRRTYLRLRPEALSTLVPAPLQAKRVVFVCTHNSARSQLAAALWHDRTGQPAKSAGTHPARRVHPHAVSVARRHGLRLKPTATTHIDEVLHTGDLVVAVCDNAYEELLGGAWPRLHWSVPDPVSVGTVAAFEAAYTELADRVDRLAPALAHGGRHG
jgi:ArsR family transcriptional regulator, arsenate/arsenite/antimonite-responsive transcriptional repressor / arsenate reductase (thioredoxin)